MARGYQNSAGIEYPTGATDPADEWDAIVPSDGATLSRKYRGLFVTVAGQLTIRSWNDVDMTIAVSVGDLLPLRPKQVRASGTTATVFGIY